MIEARTDLKPGNWQITATTLECGHVDEAVTIMVYSDWKTSCVWYSRYKEKSGSNKKQKFDKTIRSKIEKCRGPECPLGKEYRDNLIKEEFGTQEELLK